MNVQGHRCQAAQKEHIRFRVNCANLLRNWFHICSKDNLYTNILGEHKTQATNTTRMNCIVTEAQYVRIAHYYYCFELILRKCVYGCRLPLPRTRRIYREIFILTKEFHSIFSPLFECDRWWTAIRMCDIPDIFSNNLLTFVSSSFSFLKADWKALHVEWHRSSHFSINQNTQLQPGLDFNVIEFIYFYFDYILENTINCSSQEILRQ